MYRGYLLITVGKATRFHTSRKILSFSKHCLSFQRKLLDGILSSVDNASFPHHRFGTLFLTRRKRVARKGERFGVSSSGGILCLVMLVNGRIVEFQVI